jgi:hypothetical protein
MSAHVFIVDHKDRFELIIVELKSAPPEELNIVQLHSYLDWVRQYFPMNRSDLIRPVLSSLPPRRRGSKRLKANSMWFEKFGNLTHDVIDPLRIEFDVNDSEDINFVIGGNCR